ncbi:hypothetical protein Z043_103100 [Scleropages formosus]|uniref:PPM-type phosphatase domain-containing protein n=1 Tax=Scleropages formosus TaxID=113540 RepID=A0A0P7VN70_SCLFO|nr:hypothetical protein Z043_103100 [Scleropages formosus]
MDYFFHTDEVKTIVKSSRDAVKMVKGKVAEIMQNDKFGGLDVMDAEFSKTWEYKSNNVAVYSIQGRRDHMEDRFEVLTDIANKSHPSIFGIFDGHGGEIQRWAEGWLEEQIGSDDLNIQVSGLERSRVLGQQQLVLTGSRSNLLFLWGSSAKDSAGCVRDV